MSDGPSGQEELTPREREILRLAREGLSNNEIAERLGLKHNALRFHLKHLHAKLMTDGQRGALAGGGGRRWGWLPLAFTGWLGPTAAAAAVVVVSAGGYLAVRAANQSHSGDAAATSSPSAIPTTILPATQPSLADIAQQCHLAVSTLEQLNPGIKEPLDFGEGVVVPVNKHCQASAVASTPPATSTVAVGTLTGTPTTIQAMGGNAALFGTFPDATDAPTMTANIHAISPSHMGMVHQADTRTPDNTDPHGICAEITLDDAAPNFQWFRMAVDDTEVTHQFTDVVHPGEDSARLCYAPKEGLGLGTHLVSLVVAEPGTNVALQRVAWEFAVVPEIGD